METITKVAPINVSEMLSKINPDQCRQLVSDVEKTGTPLFTTHDLRTTSQPLAQIARLFLIKNNITRERFESLHRKMGLSTYMSTNIMNYDRNNILRAMAQGNITWNFLEKLLIVCGFDLTDLTLTLTNQETGEVSSISRSDVQELIKDNPYHPNITIQHVDRVIE